MSLSCGVAGIAGNLHPACRRAYCLNCAVAKGLHISCIGTSNWLVVVLSFSFLVLSILFTMYYVLHVILVTNHNNYQVTYYVRRKINKWNILYCNDNNHAV